MIFKSGYRITQLYGVNYNYYKQFGLDGHEGLDLCPLDADWNIRSFDYRGICVKDIDNPRDGGAYGNYTTIWYPELNLAFQYCHMAKNYISKNDVLEPGTLIGVMGNSGNSHGAHVHLNCIAVDKNGYRQKNYGMNGRIDPLLPLLALFGSPVNISGVPWYTYVEDNPEFRGFM